MFGKPRKLQIGWFTFTCSEDSTIIMTELLNDHWLKWKEKIEFRYAPILKSNNIFDKFDIAFVEGAINSEEQIKRLKKIRKKSKRLIAVGSCAINGMPAGQRNFFDKKTKKEIEIVLKRFSYLPKVLKVSDIVKIDERIDGCPINERDFCKVFERVINSLLKN